jgi:hypothetical protein
LEEEEPPSPGIQ